MDTRSNPWYINNPAAKSNGITADTGLDSLDCFNSTGKTKTRQQKSRGFDDRSETQRDRNLVGSFICAQPHNSLCHINAASLVLCQKAKRGKPYCFNDDD